MPARQNGNAFRGGQGPLLPAQAGDSALIAALTAPPAAAPAPKAKDPNAMLEALGKMLGALGGGQGQQQLQPNLPPLTRGQGGTLQMGQGGQGHDPRQQAMAIAQMFARQQQLQQQQQGGLAGLLGLGKNILG